MHLKSIQHAHHLIRKSFLHIKETSPAREGLRAVPSHVSPLECPSVRGDGFIALPMGLSDGFMFYVKLLEG